jgi:hypothetical protein
MHKNLLKISLLTLLTAAVVAIAPSSRADDTNAAAASAPSMKGKISGTVSAVDTNAMTFVVEDQTYSVSDDSQITRNGKPATLADVVVGDPVKGSYMKGDDGKMTVTKVKFGKMKKKKSADTSGSMDTNAPPTTAQ